MIAKGSLLLTRTSSSRIPAELDKCFLPTDKPAFELLRTAGEVRLWRSTMATRRTSMHHIVVGAELVMGGMNLQNATANFGMYVAMDAEGLEPAA
ncbi:hypothetical protein LJR130_001065 [Variovorax sp. LjRoot130]|uniref:hypothetical protein n=1 Tax=Variovorax sp. LjRoot130 TaxID=3342261 RepID=UPI003ECE8D12